MAASATIDIISSENTAVSESKGKYCSSASNAFANVLDTVNKKNYYSQEETSNTTKTTTKDLSKNTNDTSSDPETKVKDKTADDASSDSKTKVKDKTADDASSDSKTKVKDKTADNTDVKATENTEPIANKTDETKDTVLAKEVVNMVENQVTTAEPPQGTADNQSILKDLTAAIETTKTQPDINPAQIVNEPATTTAPQADTKVETDPNTATKAKTEDAATTVAQLLQAQVQLPVDVLTNIVGTSTQTLNAGISNLTTPSNNVDIKEVPTKQSQSDASATLTNTIQPQVQQPLTNIKVESATVNAQLQQLPATEAQETSIKTPVIEVNTEKMASDVTLNTDAKQNVKDMLDKTSLTQEMLDKTNAKVVNVTTPSSSGSNSNPNPDNLLNQAQEQVIKLSVQNANNLNQSLNVAATADTLTQPSFDKTLNNINVQAQGSKELTNTDVLSQINSKINNLSEETSKVTIVLRPESLGKISIELVNGKGGLTAQMTTDNPQVKEVLDKNLDGLKNSLGNQGVNVNNVSVKVTETQKQDNTFSFDTNEQGNKQPQDNKQMQENRGSLASNPDDLTEDTQVDALTEAEAEESNLTETHTGQVDFRA